MTDSIDKLHRAIWTYIDHWQTDQTGPWWEADLSLDIGLALNKVFGQEEPVKVDNLPSFLGAWPRVQFRQFGSNNYIRSNRETVEASEVKQEASPKRVGGGRFPDYYYRKGESDDCEWVVELKLWSVNGNRQKEMEVAGALKGLNDEAVKWCGKETYPFVLLAINIPSQFEQGRRRHTYKPDDFAQLVVNEVRSSAEFQELNNQGDGAVVIKSIDETSARLISCVATSRFANSPWRSEKIEVTKLDA